MDEEDFARAFIKALSHESVLNKLSIITKDLCAEIVNLRSVIEKEDETIVKLEKRVSQLENDQDTLEQYTRRNSLRVSGLQELENECLGQTCGSTVGCTALFLFQANHTFCTVGCPASPISLKTT